MAYCASCGAYIPDGQTRCLACGYDEAEKAREEESSAAAQAAAQQHAFDQEELHRKLEEQRRRQQEENRQWAEQERARRQRQEADRQWAQEELRRRQEERAQQEAASSPAQTDAVRTGTSTGGNRALAVLSYFSVLFALPYFFAPQDEFAMYHAKQGLRLFLFSLAVDIFGSLFALGWLGSLLRIYFIFKGVSTASEGKKEPLPYIGTWNPKKQ